MTHVFNIHYKYNVAAYFIGAWGISWCQLVMIFSHYLILALLLQSYYHILPRKNYEATTAGMKKKKFMLILCRFSTQIVFIMLIMALIIKFKLQKLIQMVQFKAPSALFNHINLWIIIMIQLRKQDDLIFDSLLNFVAIQFNSTYASVWKDLGKVCKIDPQIG